MKTVYVADDGKQFNNSKQCEEYENSLKRKTLLTVSKPNDAYNCYIVKIDNNGTLYIEHWEGDYRAGGCEFNGTLKEYLRRLL